MITSTSWGSSGATKWIGEWTTGTIYAVDHQVVNDSDVFVCVLGHEAAAGNEPGTGASWQTYWTKQVDVQTVSEISAPFNTTTGHDHDGTDSKKIVWNDITKTVSNLNDIATKSHTVLSNIGTNTHAQIDSHIADADKHRLINDSGTAVTDLWSANKIDGAIAAAGAGVLSVEAAVIDKDLTEPPVLNTSGDRYIVAATGTGDWAGHDGDIAEYGTGWTFTDATAGMAVYVTDESLMYLYSGTTWNPVGSFALSDGTPEATDYTVTSAGVASTISRSDHSHELAEHHHHLSNVEMETFGEATYTLEDYIHTRSAGRISGGVISEAVDGVDITEYHCLLKTSESDLGHVEYVIIPAGNIPSTDLQDNTLNYIVADYNEGAPRFLATTNRAGISTNTQIILGRVYSELGDLEIYNGGMNLPNQERINHDRLVARGFERMSGADVYEIGERYLGLTAGTFYFGMNKISIAAINTSTTGTYTRYLRDPLSANGWTRVEGLTQSTNLHYDDGSGTPAELPDGTYAVRWVYVCLADELYLIDGQNYFTLAEAKTVQQPSNRPDYLVKNAKLAAKLIILKGADHFEMVISGYESALFGTIGPSQHEGLANLYGGDSTNGHWHLALAEHTALTTDLSDTITGITDTLYATTDHTHDYTEVFSAIDHDHDETYSAVAHNHDETYSAIAHNHDETYSTTDHNHALTGLTDYVAPTAWNPTAVWTTTAPVGITVSARYLRQGKLVSFWLYLYGSDGDGQIPVSFTLPVTPANTGLPTICSGTRIIDTTRTDPFAYVDTTQAVAGNRLLKFYTSNTFTNGRSYSMVISGTYEAA